MTEIFAEFWHGQNKSKFRLERVFNNLSKKERRVVLLAGDVSRDDLVSPDLLGNRFSHFSDKGRLKIVDGIHFLRDLTIDTLPQSVGKTEAFNLDPDLNKTEVVNKVA